MSKGLEALENIKHYDTRVGLHEKDYEFIEKELKAFEIIKTKRVDVIRLFQCFKIGALSNYNNFYAYKKLTQEEYDLLKEVLL